MYIILNGTLTAQSYIEEILRHRVVLYAAAIDDSFLFMHDNASPHTGRLVKYILKAETIKRMKISACSPYMNPIKHILGHTWTILWSEAHTFFVGDLEEWNSILLYRIGVSLYRSLYPCLPLCLSIKNITNCEINNFINAISVQEFMHWSLH